MDERSPLPAHADAWARAALGGPAPEEPESTCGDCAQCAPAGAAPRLARAGFRPDTKCCTFHPTFPNFLVGRLLRDETAAGAEGRARVRAMLPTAQAGPLLLRPPAEWSSLYAAHKADFGRSLRLRCPLYEAASGGCTAWAHREAVCATYFCKHTRGRRGETFWADLRGLLAAVEQALARWCLLQLDLDDATLRRALQPPERALAAPDDEAARRLRWGAWAGREEPFYRACAAQVDGLEWADILRIGGPLLEARARLVRASYARLAAEEPPSPLRIAPFQVVELAAESATISGYSALDPLQVPRVLLEVLPAFDGRPVALVLAELAGDGIEVDPALVTRLADFGLLEPVEFPLQ